MKTHGITLPVTDTPNHVAPACRIVHASRVLQLCLAGLDVNGASGARGAGVCDGRSRRRATLSTNILARLVTPQTSADPGDAPHR